MNGLKNDMLNMKKWAVVGVTPRIEKFGYKIWRKLEEHKYTVYGINPKYDEIEGDKTYRSLKDLPEKVDVVDVVVGPKITMGLLDEIKEEGIEYVFFQPGTYNDEVIEKADKLGLKYLLDDCIYATLVKMEN